MVRWEPGAKERLQVAAIDLFLERGFDQTTVQEIAQAAGLTERTFFRHFADKREVLFVGGDVYQATFLIGARRAPDGSTAFEVAVAAIAEAASFFTSERRAWSRKRQAVIDANPALQERELLKSAMLGTALTEELRDRGIPAEDAALAAETGVTVFTVAFRRWIAEGEDRTLLELERDVLARLTAMGESVGRARRSRSDARRSPSPTPRQELEP